MKYFALLTTCLALIAIGSGCVSKSNTAIRTPSPQLKTYPNQSYQPPSLTPPAPRSPSVSLPYSFNRSVGVSHSSGRSDQRYVAMTFDDGPHAKNTPRLLAMLRERNIKATFYVIGKNVQRYPDLTRRIVAEGHELGNHTWTHGKLSAMSNDRISGELDRTKAAIISATGVQPRTMRPPYGALLQRQRQWIFNKYGYPTILWSVDPQDWKRPGPSVVASRILSNAKNGSIILAHDLHAPTIDAMPATLDGLLKRGFKFVTVSQLLAQKGNAPKQ